jgi:YD repeat-containing protein
MNKTIVILIFSFLSIQLIAQGSQSQSGGYDYAGEINNLLNFPKSPEAEAFEKYGNTQINLYTGKPNIDIPLHVLQGKEYNIPISLSYDAGGIKVNQVATNVGLGWNLVCGGRISVMVNGLPDYGGNTYTPANQWMRDRINEYTTNRYNFSTMNKAIQYANFLKNIGEGYYDTQYDYYSINVGNINDYIIMDSQTYEPRTLKNPNIKVSGSPVTGWVITDEDGTKYYFNQETIETTRTEGSDIQLRAKNLIQSYTSSWLISKIESKNKKDTFIFEYNQYNMGVWFKTSLASKSVVKDLLVPVGNPVTNINYNYQTEQASKSTQLMLSFIKHNGQVVANFNYVPREDIIYEVNNQPNFNQPTALESIFFPMECNDKQVEFSYSYFGNTSQTNPMLKYKDIRLKLDDVTVKGYNSTALNNPTQFESIPEKKYSFEYIQPQFIPRIDSNGIDYFGLYNGADGNSDLIPSFSLGNFSVPGAIRSSNFTYMKIGTLNKITYPTGGYSVFEYEPHSGFSNDFAGQLYDKYNIYADVSVGSGDGPSGSINNCMLDTLGNYPNTQTTTFTLTENDFQTVGPEQEGLISYGLFYLITDGYAFIKKISNELVCQQWGEPICERPDHNHSLNNPASQCNWAVTPCIDGQYVPSIVHANQFCFTDPHTTQQIGVYNTGGVLNSSFSFGYDLSQNPNSPFRLDSPGTYQLTIIGDPSPASNGSRAFIYRKETFMRNLFEHGFISGFRIKSIKDYINQDSLAIEKRYQYTKDIEGIYSSTRVLDKNRGVHVKQSLQRTCHSIGMGTPSIGITEVFEIGAHEQNSHQENVVYSSVIEIQIKDSLNVGYTLHKFNVGPSGFINNGDLGKYFEHNETFGKPTEISTYNKDNELISQQRNEYRYFDENPIFNYSTNTGFIVNRILDFGEGLRYLLIYNLGNNLGYGFHYFYPIWGCFGAGCCPQPTPPDHNLIQHLENALGTEDIHVFINYGGFDYELVPQFATSIFGAQIKKTSIEYHPNGELVTEQEFRYDQSNYNLLRETKTTDLSDNSTISQVNYYPSDYTQYGSMIGDNRLTEVIKTETYRNGELLQVRENEYANHVNGWFPSVVKIAKGEQDLEPRIFIKYDYAGNIIEIKNSEDPTSETVESYIWGYNKKYPVAKIAGVQHQNIPANLITAIENVTVYDCAPELNANLLTAYQNLQNALPTAQITFYSYHANGKLKAMTSPNGQTMYYHYDELQRLVKVVDQYGAILSENEYKFRTQN